MSRNSVVICAGCLNRFDVYKTYIYRKKRCCGSESCVNVIDQKVASANYKKQQKKMAKGKFRHGVPPELKQLIYSRDGDNCKLCCDKINMFEKQIHHIIPVSENGTDDLTNLVLLCKQCHTEVHKKGHQNYYGKFGAYIESLEEVY